MKTRNISLAEQLDEVLKKNIDAQKGYAKASENAESTYLQDFFLRKSNERKSFNDELRTALRTAYGTIENEGSLKGTLHRTWMDIKNMFSADSDEAMLEECLRGDKAAIEEYTELLENTSLPMDVSTVIRNQMLKLRSDLNKVSSLEDLYDKKS